MAAFAFPKSEWQTAGSSSSQEAYFGCFVYGAACPAEQERQVGSQQGAGVTSEQLGDCWLSLKPCFRSEGSVCCQAIVEVQPLGERCPEVCCLS